MVSRDTVPTASAGASTLDPYRRFATALSGLRLPAAFVDLDGPLWLTEDRPGGVVDRDGMLSPPLPGFWGTPA